MKFEYVLKVLGGKIAELNVVDNCGCHREKMDELRRAIQLLVRLEQGVVTGFYETEPYSRVVFFDDNASES